MSNQANKLFTLVQMKTINDCSNQIWYNFYCLDGNHNEISALKHNNTLIINKLEIEHEIGRI